MYFWPFSSDDAAKNLAIDESLLEVVDEIEASRSDPSTMQDVAVEVLRLWEMPYHAVVLGRSSPSASEVNAGECAQFRVPILRRCSGGATILAGPGCLMYTAVLSLRTRPHLASIDEAHDFAMERLSMALAAVGIAATREGICDLTVEAKKISGNAMRLKRSAVLYHGTLLYGLDVALASRVLGTPQRQPDYRGGRSHEEFIGNAAASRGELIRALREAFAAHLDWGLFPYREAVARTAERLLSERYSQSTWTK